MLPAFPAIPADALRAKVTDRLRYEDVSQDGRLFPHAVTHAASAAVWSSIVAQHPVQQGMQRGVIPLLTRLHLEGGEGPMPVNKRVRADGAFQLAHTLGPDGSVARILMRSWVEVWAPRGRTHELPCKIEHEGQLLLAGRLYSESTFTRPFAPPGERKVLRFDPWAIDAGLAPVPAARVPSLVDEELLQIPEGACALDQELLPDDAPTAFGLLHTDSNQHVNSLVYPRLFEEAVLRRLAKHGRSTALIARHVEIGYRKPCFAGDRMRIVLRLFETSEGVGAVGGFVPDTPEFHDSLAALRSGALRPHSCLRIHLAP